MRIGAAATQLILAGLLMASAVTATGAAGAGAQESAVGTEAFSRLSSCVGNSGQLLVMLLVDESGSLRQTDPHAERVAAGRVALSGLRSLAASSGVSVEVRLAGFSADYRPVGAWTILTDASLPGLERDLGGFADRDNGIDTDYFIALRGAQEEFAARTAALADQPGAAPCKALLWFTDGKYDIEDRTGANKRYGVEKDYAPGLRLDEKGAGARLVAHGRDLLCRSGGLADNLRGDDVEMFTIPLATQIAEGDLALLRAITSGGGSVTCGADGTAGSGATLDAANLGDLLGAFDRAASEIARGVRQPGDEQAAVCMGAPCPEGRRTFDIDDTLRRFHLLARTEGHDIQVVLDGPAGSGTVRMEPGRAGQATIGDVPVRWSWPTTEAVTIDADHPASGKGWDGTWAVTFVDPTGTQRDAIGRSQIYLFGDLTPALLGPAQLVAGDTNQLQIGLVSDVDGTTRAIPDATVEVTVSDPATGRVTSAAVTSADRPGHYTAAYPLPDDTSAGEAVVTMRLIARTRSGVALAPAERTVKLPIRVAGLPTVRLEHDRLAALKGHSATTASVIITGDPATASCVWLAGTRLDGPRSAGSFSTEVTPRAVDAGSCLPVPAGETRRLAVDISASGTANGTAEGSLQIAATSELRPEPRTVSLSYQVPMTRPINAAKRLGVFLALLLPGLLLPVLAAYLGAWWAGRFRAVRLARSALLNVRVTSGRVERVEADGTASPFGLTLDDFDSAVPAMPQPFRRLEHRGYTITARLSPSPFAAPYGEVRRSGSFAGGSALRCTTRDGRGARIGLALPNQWVLIISEPAIGSDPAEEDAPKAAQLLVLVDGTVSPEDLQRISNQVQHQAPAAAAVLADKARAWLEASQPKAQSPKGRKAAAPQPAAGGEPGGAFDPAPFSDAPFGDAPFGDAPFDGPPDRPAPFDPLPANTAPFGPPTATGPAPSDGRNRPSPSTGIATRTNDDPPWDQ